MLKNTLELPGGALRMGSDRSYPEERPVREVAVDCSWIDWHPVTVAEFRRFVKTNRPRDLGGAASKAEQRCAREMGKRRDRTGADRFVA